MKSFFAILLCFAIASCERITAPTESQSTKQKRVGLDEYYSFDSTFQVQNLTHINVGLVKVLLSDSTNVWINVPDSGVYSAHISLAPIACFIHGESLPYSTATWIWTTSNTKVSADWNQNIVIIDKSETY